MLHLDSFWIIYMRDAGQKDCRLGRKGSKHERCIQERIQTHSRLSHPKVLAFIVVPNYTRTISYLCAQNFFFLLTQEYVFTKDKM